MRPVQDDLYYRFLLPLEDISILSIPSEQVHSLWGLLNGDLSPACHLLSAELITGVDRDRQSVTYLLVSYLNPYGHSALRLIKTGRSGDAAALAFQPQFAWDFAG